ncbi:hypothetical protein M728_002172 [Ensifer sp. WSM1721]|uniref:DUF5132 domain-containing protein n=1 Tax=Ensifer sp. WSM1721 TaxID=1041159 RepID=UPI0004B0160A|nr:DUF5132 domain-containing protein [Ensifer sp. WSM1721]
MAILEDAFKGNVMTAVAIGIGAVVLRPIVVPVVRPLFKAALKAGLVAYDQGRVAVAELGEGYEDLMAEARAEMSAANGGIGPTESAEPAARRPAPKASTSRDEDQNKNR